MRDSGDVFFFLVLFPLLFAGMWFTITTLLRSLAGMRKRLEVEPGVPIRSSGWGSASINGVNARGCVKLDEYQAGFVLRMMWILGGGMLWLPKSGLRVSAEEPRRLFFPRHRVLISGMNRVVLYDRLSAFVPTSDPG